MAWFYFDQNNSGGGFDHEPERGIGYGLFIEADNADAANIRAEEIGLYFNGCDDGRDCPCCGDRWHRAWGEPDAVPTRYSDAYRPAQEGEAPAQEWGLPLYIHPLTGPFVVAVEVSP